jgi:hypothetical protein
VEGEEPEELDIVDISHLLIMKNITAQPSAD